MMVDRQTGGAAGAKDTRGLRGHLLATDQLRSRAIRLLRRYAFVQHDRRFVVHAERHDEGPRARLRHHRRANGPRPSYQSHRRQEVSLLSAGSRADQTQSSSLFEYHFRHGFHSRPHEAFYEKGTYGYGR